MKKIRFVPQSEALTTSSNKKIAYIEDSDIRTLLESKDFVRKEIFSEPAIVNKERDMDGFYRIEDPENVKYIEELAYIPDYDFLTSLSKEEICILADQTLENRNKIYEIIEKLCNYKQKLSASDRKILRKTNYLDNYCTEWLEENVLNASLKGSMFRSMEKALLAQVRNYTNALVKIAEQPQLPDNGQKRKHL